MKRISRIAAALLFALGCSTAVADTVADKDCPKMLQVRGVHEVMTAQITLFKAGPRALACNYDQDAVLLLPGVAAAGRQQIEAAYTSLFEAYGGDLAIEVNSLTESDSAALMDYTIVSGNDVVLRGVDTFVIEAGLVKVQSHAVAGTSGVPRLNNGLGPRRYHE
ncbi:MAG TPA: nuclear transport factor 2 family protein [Steroidobacteraceae bacterium]